MSRCLAWLSYSLSYPGESNSSGRVSGTTNTLLQSKLNGSPIIIRPTTQRGVPFKGSSDSDAAVRNCDYEPRVLLA